MRLTHTLTFALAIAMFSSSLSAQDNPHLRYKWRDAHGVQHYTDTLPPEALTAGYDVVDKNGYVIKHVERALTDEERKAGAAAAAEEAATQQHAREQTKADQQLLGAYATEEALAVVQKARLESIDQAIQSVRLSQSDQEKSLAEQLTHAASLDRNGKPVPPVVHQQIETLRKNIEAQKAFIARKQNERAAIVQKSAAEMIHYRELRAQQNAPARP